MKPARTSRRQVSVRMLQKGLRRMENFMPRNELTKHAELAGTRDAFTTLAKLLGMPFDPLRYGEAEGTVPVASGVRMKLERMAREHLGTAAIAVLQGVMSR